MEGFGCVTAKGNITERWKVVLCWKLRFKKEDMDKDEMYANPVSIWDIIEVRQ